MVRFFNCIAVAAGFGVSLLASYPSKTSAQTYPIDCAILLCLSAGWPESAPCRQARAVFIRRITPWPVEPPLQIWRCPMGGSYGTDSRHDLEDRLRDIYFDEPSHSPGSSFGTPDQVSVESLPAVARVHGYHGETAPLDLALLLAQQQADIDISGPEFNFVRSIRVFHVRYAEQRRSSRDEDCNRSVLVELGSYGRQGAFSWARSSLSALPDAHVGLERWGRGCQHINHRSVFVDWRDFEGNYGFEQVNY